MKSLPLLLSHLSYYHLHLSLSLSHSYLLNKCLSHLHIILPPSLTYSLSFALIKSYLSDSLSLFLTFYATYLSLSHSLFLAYSINESLRPLPLSFLILSPSLTDTLSRSLIKCIHLSLVYSLSLSPSCS